MRLVNFFTSARKAVVLTVVALAAVTSIASAANRSPQVSFISGNLQAYLTTNDGGINVLTDQLNSPLFQSNVSGVTDFTLMVKIGGNASTDVIGVYNGGTNTVPGTLYSLFPTFATNGWFATCVFKASGALYVYLYDNSNPNVFQGLTAYSGVDRNHIGFYVQNTVGTFYSEDILNSGSAPQALTYAGTGANAGDIWECFQDSPYAANSSTFQNVVLLLQSVAATPTSAKSWGSVKAGYR